MAVTRPPLRKSATGFTLLEVLVALAVLSITMAALIKGGGENAANAGYLRDRTLAHWVGMNTVAEYQLAENWPDTGRFQGEEEMAGRRWYWRAEVSETFDEDIRRLDVTVYVDAPAFAQASDGAEGQGLASLAAFLPRTAVQGAVP